MASQLRHGGNDESPNSEEIIESSVCSEHELQLPRSQDRSRRTANDSVNSWLRSSFQFSNVNLTVSPAQPQSSPSKICIEHDFDSETESSSTIHAPPPRIPRQPLTPDTKWRTLRAAAALSRERVQALASSPVGSSTSQSQSSPSKIWVDRDLDSETESSSTIRAPPPRIPRQPLTPDTKWRMLRAAAALSRERVQALASSPVISSTSPASEVQKSPPFDSSPSMQPWSVRRASDDPNEFQHPIFTANGPPQTSQLTPTASCFRNHPRRRMTRHQAGKAAGRSHCNSSRSRTLSSLPVKLFL